MRCVLQSFVNGMVGWADGSQHCMLAPRIIIITIVIPSSFTVIVIILMKISSVRSSHRLFRRPFQPHDHRDMSSLAFSLSFRTFFTFVSFFSFLFSLLIIPVGNTDVYRPFSSCVLWFFISFLHCVDISRPVKDLDNCPRLPFHSIPSQPHSIVMGLRILILSSIYNHTIQSHAIFVFFLSVSMHHHQTGKKNLQICCILSTRSCGCGGSLRVANRRIVSS